MLSHAYTRVRLRRAISVSAFATMTVTLAASPGEVTFLAENRAAMDTMMRDMTIKPSGDVDRDFIAMMIPHHQGAVEMAQAELRYGRNEQLRRIAQEIIVDQRQEIDAMRLALGESSPPPILPLAEAPKATADVSGAALKGSLK